MHPVMKEYISAIDTIYGKRIRDTGKYNEYKLNGFRKRVRNAGIELFDYMMLAVNLNKSLAEHRKWPYPYFNIVTSDSTFEKVVKLLEVHSNTEDDMHGYMVEREMNYARMYIEYLMGATDAKPIRSVQVTQKVKEEVAKNLCATYGIVPPVISYPHIAQVLMQ